MFPVTDASIDGPLPMNTPKLELSAAPSYPDPGSRNPVDDANYPGIFRWVDFGEPHTRLRKSSEKRLQRSKSWSKELSMGDDTLKPTRVSLANGSASSSDSGQSSEMSQQDAAGDIDPFVLSSEPAIIITDNEALNSTSSSSGSSSSTSNTTSTSSVRGSRNTPKLKPSSKQVKIEDGSCKSKEEPVIYVKERRRPADTFIQDDDFYEYLQECDQRDADSHPHSGDDTNGSSSRHPDTIPWLTAPPVDKSTEMPDLPFAAVPEPINGSEGEKTPTYDQLRTDFNIGPSSANDGGDSDDGVFNFGASNRKRISQVREPITQPSQDKSNESLSLVTPTRAVSPSKSTRSISPTADITTPSKPHVICPSTTTTNDSSAQGPPPATPLPDPDGNRMWILRGAFHCLLGVIKLMG